MLENFFWKQNTVEEQIECTLRLELREINNSIKITMDILCIILSMTNERINDLEDRSGEITQNAGQKAQKNIKETLTDTEEGDNPTFI